MNLLTATHQIDHQENVMSSQKPIRILQVVHRMRLGGIQALVMGVYRNIDRSQMQFDFAVRSQQEEYYDREIQSLGGRIFRLPWRSKNPFSPWVYRRELNKVLKEEGAFAAVHSHVNYYSGLVIPVAQRAGVPVRIAHSHSTAFDRYNPLIVLIWETLMRKAILRSATHLLACNTCAAEWLYGQDWERDQRVSIVHNAIDIRPFENPPEDRHIIRKRLGIPAKGTLLGHVGRFDTHKNHFFLIKIMKEFLNLQPDAQLLLIGEGELYSAVQAEVSTLGLGDKVHFLGVRNDVPDLLQAMDLFLLPSLFEGLPLVLVEAQAAGLPCLVSDTVPYEADLDLGLIKYESLKRSPRVWARRIQQVLSTSPVAWELRKAALLREGHDISCLVSRLVNIYSGQT